MNDYYEKKRKDSMEQVVYLVWLLLIAVGVGLCYCTHKWLTHKCPQQMANTEPKLMRVTAYCPCEKCCGQWADGQTASGHWIKAGDRFVAAPKHIPFGTILDIPGYGVVPVLDRGGAITVDRLDVFFSTHQEALIWGVQYLTVKEK